MGDRLVGRMTVVGVGGSRSIKEQYKQELIGLIG